MTFLDYISQVGGLLGLFIGFSVISAIEIIYWLTFRWSKNAFYAKNEEKVGPAVYDPPKTGISDKKLMTLKSFDGQA